MPRSALRRYFRHGLFPQLVVFEAVARLGGVTRAAEELHLAQPTVSMQLKKLSGTLELQLFEPDGRRLRITPGGEALLGACRELNELFTRTEERLSRFRQAKTERLRPVAEPEARAAREALLERLAAAFVREALMLGAYNPADASGEKEPWKSRAITTRR